MPRDGSGNYSRPVNSVDPAVTNTTISSTDFNQLTLDLATEMTDSLSRSGKGAVLANIDFGVHRITNLGAQSAGTDAARKDYVDNSITGVTMAGDVTGPFSSSVVANVQGGVTRGLTTGSAPTSAFVGFTSSGTQSAFGIGAATPSNVVAVSLAAGNWLVIATIGAIPTGTTVTSLIAAVTTTSGSVGAGVFGATVTGTGIASATIQAQATGYVGLASPANVYGTTQIGFSGGSMQTYGSIIAIRMP